MSSAPPSRLPTLFDEEDGDEVTLIRAKATGPEHTYKHTSGAERIRQRAAVLAKYTPHAVKLAHHMCRVPTAWPDAEQAAFEGVVVALESYDPERGHFWPYAKRFVMKTVCKWKAEGFYWREQRSDSRMRTAEQAERAKAQAFFAPLTDDEIEHADTAEDMLVDAEARALLAEFLDTLSPDEAHLLLCEKRKTTAYENNARSRAHQELVQRARAHVLGSDDK